MYKIVPVNIPIVGEVDTLTIQINSFNMQPGENYSLTAYINLSGTSAFYEKNITIPADVVSQWLDDQVIVDYVVEQLGLTLDTISDTEPQA